jgi:hypothetical protein
MKKLAELLGIMCNETYLIGDMVPVVLAAKVFKVFFEQGSHFNDSIGHTLDFPEPLTVPALVVEDFGCNACTVDRWVRVKRPDKNLKLRIDPFLFVF